VALITALLILFLVSAIIVGMSWMVVSDQHLSGNNQDRELAFYGAEAGLEKMTADMGQVFASKGSITSGDIPNIVGFPPTMQGITFANSNGTTYQLMCPPPNVCVDPQGAQFFATIQPPSAFAGMQGQITPLTLRVAAQTADGAEVKLQRQVELVAIPVFQFGVFSNTDLSFFNGPVFDFGGRVHTNGNLWLAANDGPVFFRNTITVSGQVIRSNLENGLATVSGGQYGGAVVISRAPNAVPPPTGEPASPYQNASWWTLDLGAGSMNPTNVYGALSGSSNSAFANSIPAQAGMISIGSPQLNLISTALGGLQTPVALIRRPDPGEALANPSQFSQRYFTNVEPMTASLRILLDDYVSGTCTNVDMLALDSVSSTTPVDLASLPNIAKSGATSATYTAANGYWQKSTNPTISGCLKIEYLNSSATPTATDVTAEILAHGYRGRNLNPSVTWVAPPTLSGLQSSGTEVVASTCADPDPNAIIRIERVRDNPSTGAGCGPANGTGLANTDYWPNVLFDTREGVPRDGALPPNGSGTPTTDKITAVGDMYYIELDVANLAKWFRGTLGAPDTGTNANNVGGYSVYFSDRRGNAIDTQVAPNKKTASLGYNDFVNPASANACPNNTMDAGEDLEGDGVLRTYGGALEPVLPVNPETAGLSHTPTNLQYANNGLCTNVPPLWGLYASANEARENPAMFFRHALKLVDGSTINLGTTCYGASPNPPCGLTIASENPVYIQGDFNAPGGSLTAAGTVATSVAADAVTLLSDSFNDVNTYISPYDTGNRNALTTAYRVAIIAGKQIPFALPAGESQADFGTDGGLHNFLRYIENWGSATLNYQGSLVSFYYNRQAVGLYKSISYSPPNRVYAFDGNFTQGPQWLPPRTPTLRTVNTTGFSQMLMPTQ
jgi:hypothetical protein